MKKTVGIVICIIIVVGLIIGGVYFFTNRENNEAESNEQTNYESRNESNEQLAENNNEIENTTTENTSNESSKILVTYFSLPETTGDAKEDSTITVNGEVLGNTQYVANLIKDELNADIFRIEPVKEYNISDHQALIDDAQEEQRQNARPEIKNKIDNFEDYDTIFIGYPIWWSDLPQILYTFLESYDFTGKNVYLFSTNGGSGLSGTVSTITEKLNTAKVNTNAFKLYRENMEEAPDEVETWLKDLGF